MNKNFKNENNFDHIISELHPKNKYLSKKELISIYEKKITAIGSQLVDSDPPISTELKELWKFLHRRTIYFKYTYKSY